MEYLSVGPSSVTIDCGEYQGKLRPSPSLTYSCSLSSPTNFALTLFEIYFRRHIYMYVLWANLSNKNLRQESVVFVLVLNVSFALCHALDPSDGPHFPVANWRESNRRLGGKHWRRVTEAGFQFLNKQIFVWNVVPYRYAGVYFTI